ncbi:MULTISPECIES: pantoate--beta-alanine ligase [unclassified Fusibacter]|uniref:pantoate--beta-alanine ligase n=1 Tax=unclassified Fusibacter TaxID=2624464 RepID=UPI0010116696|nr:pantoate--beta-alanine ligase [Fusibacter sp. A1]MCK8061032.1 pantoate--beta-alanine ligase [Fusibacter sp. A2]NPE20514.1 pantoate--beta-alanine ligase [Fusibacter sp. A1]RXV63714.1 pantoate--beta-alanine ligase [Fusibacter sp. A1]
MISIKSIGELKAFINEAKANRKTIGFVPTMGFLHEGHLSLMKKAKEENDLVVTSVYVNPTQFGPGEDFDSYPRDEKRDSQLMDSVGVDACFFPTDEMMYPRGFQTYIETQGSIVKGLCGAKREGHFKGVTTIVGKLFNLVKPDRAYFGQKDAQQVAVISRMVEDLNFDVKVVPCPIVRESDGLAMSSRNKYLSEEARVQALCLSSALARVKTLIEKGERSANVIEKAILNHILPNRLAKIDYIEIVDFSTLEPVEAISGKILIALAVYIDKTRLIDNLYLEV